MFRRNLCEQHICFALGLNTSGFNQVADIRPNLNGKDNLYHDGYKFTKGHKGTHVQGWQCSKHSSEQCSAYTSTMNVNGIIMMKIVRANHNHQAGP